MISVDTALTALQEANPVPDAKGIHEFALDAAYYLAETRERSERMETLERQQTKQERRGWGSTPVLVAAAIIIVLWVGIALAFILDRGEPEPAAPIEIATSFIEARRSGDGAAMEALVSPTATIDDLAFYPSEYPRVAAFEEVLGWEITPGACEASAVETARGPGTRVACSYAVSTDVTKAMGRGPATFNSFVLEIVDGEIVSLRNTLDSAYFLLEWGPMVEWVKQHHPDQVERVINTSIVNPLFPTVPLMNDEALALWAQYAQEYVDELTASG